MSVEATSMPVVGRTPERDAALLDGQRQVLELLAGGAPLRQTLTALCEVIERRLPHVLCSILLLDPATKTLHHGAAPLLPRVYCEAVDGLAIGPSVGSCGTAAFFGRSVIVEDIEADPLWADFKAAALPHSLRACASTPIMDSERQVLGTFAIYHTRPGPFDPRELMVLADFTQLATVAIQTERRRTALAEAEAQVRQAQKLDSLGVLAGGIAHDFNNLLTVMLANLSLANLSLGPASPALPHLESVETAVLRAADLTKQMLAYSGKGRIVVRPVCVSRVVEDMTHLLSVALPKKVSLVSALERDLPLIEADVAQMEQVVMNLVTNAAEAIGDAEGTVRITTGVANLREAAAASLIPQKLAPGRYVRLGVSDTGCGMTPEVTARIFDPFFSTKKSGRGLGLSAMLGILRSHRAGLTLHSEPGRGCLFQLFFPASDAARENERPSSPGLTGRARPGGLALVVDDEPAIRQAAAQLLASLGFEVITAENGVEGVARALARGKDLSLVLMDLTMPRMGGAEALREIRKALPDLPVILCSGYTEDDALGKVPAQDLVSFLQKPYQLREVEKAVDAALRSRCATSAV